MYSVQSSFWMRFRFDGKQSGDCSTCIRVQPSVGSAQHWLAPARAQAHEASTCSRDIICVSRNPLQVHRRAFLLAFCLAVQFAVAVVALVQAVQFAVACLALGLGKEK